MHLNGWVFAHEVEPLMESLIHPHGYPRPEVMIPIDCADDGDPDRLPVWRSGWALVQPDSSDPRWDPDEGDFLTIVWPTAFLRDLLGPCALLGNTSTASTGVARSSIAEIGGRWHARVPRYFGTVGDHWSRQIRADRTALVTAAGEQVHSTTVADIDLEKSLRLGSPSLIVGPRGPVYHDHDTLGSPGTAIDRRQAAAAALMGLPGGTPVASIDIHT